MFLSRVTSDEVKEKNQLNGGFEVSNCHSTKQHCATKYVVRTYLPCLLLNIVRESD